MKTKVTLFLALLLFFFMGSYAFAQNVSGTVSTTGCLNGGVITAKNDASWVIPQYQLLKGGLVIAPVAGDATQFSDNPVFTGLASGSYVLKGRNTNAGTQFTSAAITVADGYTVMKVATPTQIAGCATGAEVLTSTVTGGKQPFTYNIALQSSPGVSIQNSGAINVASFAFNALPAGSYIVSVTDSCGQTITGATAVSVATVTLADLKQTGFYPIHWTDYNCSTPFAVAHELGFQYVANSTSLSAADAALFTWKIKYKGKLYGQDIDGDGYSDEAGGGYPITTRPIKLPKTATRDDIFADLNNMKAVVIDKCGNTREFALIQWQSGGYMNPFVCGGEGMIKVVSNRLACFPVNVKFTNLADASDVVEQSVNIAMLNVGGLKPGATYHLTYVDAGGNTTNDYWAVPTNQNITIPSAATLSMNQSLYGVQPNQNILGYGKAMVSMSPSVSDSVTFTILASSNPLVAVGSTGTGYVDANGTGTLAKINAGDPTSYWPKGNYTVQVNTACGTKNVDLAVQGYDATLSNYQTDAICGGFNYTMKGTFSDATAFQVIVVSGPSNVGQVRDLASTTASLPFNGLNFGTYVFGLRIKGGSTNVLTQTVTYDASNAIIVDKGNTGGFVCTEGATNGVLTITAATISPAPNNTLQYALSLDGGATYGAYQSSNQFPNLGKGSYYFKVKDGCGNEITQTAQIGVAGAPNATADSLYNPTLCQLSTGTIALDVDILSAVTYSWSGPGITVANKNLKNPVVNYSDLVLGVNTYSCIVTFGAPCNTTNTANLRVTLLPLPTVATVAPAAVCAGTPVNLTLAGVTTGSTANLTYTYFTDAAGTAVLGNPNAVTVDGTYYIKGTNTDGCFDIKPVKVTINPLPTVVITNPDPICSGNAVDLTADSIKTGSDSGLTYTYFSNAGATSVLPNPSTITASGTYYIKGSTALGCSTIKPVVITVNPLPTASIGATGPVCIGDAVQPVVTFTGANGTAPYTFTYTIGGNGPFTVSTVSGNSVNVPAPTAVAGNFAYALVSVKDSSTSACTQTQTGSATVTINPNATIALTSAAATANQTLCINTALTSIVYTPAAGATGATLTGTLPAGVTGSFAGGVFTISGTPTASGTFNYTVTTTGGCSSANLSGSIIVNPNATIALSSPAATANQTLCINTALTSIVYTPAAGATGATLTGTLPAGVTGSFAGGVFTISGTPTASGTFNYTVTTTGGCLTANLSGTIIVNPNATISLTSPAATASQSLCINTPLTSIVYTPAAGATGATLTGTLPAGVTGSFAGGVFTISGTPTASGTFNYTVTTTGGCLTANLSGSIIVNPNATIALSSPAATASQSLCINTPLTSIVYTPAAGATGASLTGTLPAGVTGSFAGGVFTISGTPTASGTFNYTVTTTGGCLTANLSGSITVKPNATIALTSPAATASQSLCINTPLTSIVYTPAAGATGASLTGTLPAGVTGSFTGGVFTISGTPTASGTFNYTVTTTGGCSSANLSGSIIVNPNGTIALTSPAATTNQTLCINTALTDIVYTPVSGATGASLTGTLPVGVIGSFAGGVFTISGIPTVSGTFNYTVTTTGGCSSANLSGSIIVNPNATIALTSPAATASQSLCINTALTSIVYTPAAGATGAFLTGTLPAGVTGSFAGDVFTISGTPTESGTFNYTVTTTGGCSSANLSGSITVNPNATIALTSAAATANQTLCINTALTDIVYTPLSGATGAALTGTLPAGVTGSFAGGVFTISGTPTASGTFNYTVTTTGGCSSENLSGSIIVNPNAAIALTSPAATANQTLCINTALTDIVYTPAAGATGATLTGTLPAGVTGSFAGGIFTISGTPTASGTFNYTVTTTGGCSSANLSGSITVNSLLVLNGTASTTCAADGSGYVLNFTVTGQAPYTVTGTGAPGTWSGNDWTSSPITAGTNYNVSITDAHACNTVVVADAAPICCVYEVTAPTFPSTTITCYDQMPTAVSLTKAEFEALGNGDGKIGNIPCGVIEITASNGVEPSCNGNVTRTYTVTEYADPNGNKVRDLGEDTVLNTTAVTQIFTLERADFVMP
ncbi:beta strand repeat-containing protein, partial [Flavobacterium sp. FlaQc-30]|uniref:beta strand repeat-containing protein n=1 Tax=Flavobacterium sp. FlaQc-30 TaxID=3374179 RepID=UPI003757232D